MSVDVARSTHVVEGFLRSYRRAWRATVVTSFVSPVLYLLAIGVGLGSRVNSHGALGGVDYVDFVAPGLLAAAAMQVAATESSFPVMNGIKWSRTFHATLSTPIRIPELVAGRLAWVALRIAATSAVFMLVSLPFGVDHSALAVLAFPAALATGMAFAGPIEAYAATRENDGAFVGMFRFAIVPMFLFAGTFFPISRLPGWLEPVAWATPLWHGVELCRHLMLGEPALVDLLHAAFLVALGTAGALACVRTYRGRLEV
jgi:lipooligosaccharide transport system permease protein